MKCRRVERNLSAYLDGELPAEESLRVGEHLKACSRCRRRFEELTRVETILSEFPGRDPSPFLWTRVQARLEAGRERRSRPARVFVWWASVAAASLVLVAAGIAYWRSTGERPEVAGLEVAIAEDLELYENFDLIRNLDLFESWEGES